MASNDIERKLKMRDSILGRMEEAIKHDDAKQILQWIEVYDQLP